MIMDIDKKIKAYVNKLEQQQTSHLAKDGLAYLKDFLAGYQSSIKNLKDENRKLHIGIIGQVKAGKSSFINSLIFNGRDILPKAATPMTAALTRLDYSSEPKAEIEVYSDSEWSQFKRLAGVYTERISTERSRIAKDRNSMAVSGVELTDDEVAGHLVLPAEVIAADEMVRQAAQYGMTLGDLNAKDGVITIGGSDNDTLLKQMQEYVGANGKYTPFVKCLTLYIDEPHLKDVVLIDTPGTNDPVISRGERTRRYLAKCDVVFVLSYGGQFMDRSDMNLISQNLGEAGISRMVLLGSKIDLAMTQEAKKYQKFGDKALLVAYKDIAKKLEQQAVINVSKLADNNPRMKKLLECLPAKFISSMFDQLANKESSELTKEEKFQLDNLVKRFPESKVDSNILKALGQISDIKSKVLSEVKSEKHKIQSVRIAEYQQGQKIAIDRWINEFEASIDARIHQLKNDDADSVRGRQKDLEQSMKKAASGIDLAFDNCITDVRGDLKELYLSIRTSMSNTSIATHQGSERVRTGSRTTGMLWWKETHGVYENKTYNFANTLDAIDEVDRFALTAEKELIQKIRTVIKIDELKKAIIDKAKDCFDMSSENFDLDSLITPIQKAVNKIKVPDLNLDFSAAKAKVTDRFSSDTVRGNGVNELNSVMREALKDITDSISKELNQYTGTTATLLSKTSDNFISDLLGDSKAESENLLRDIEEKDEALERMMRLKSIFEIPHASLVMEG